jgi:hypothetical protein
MSEKQYSWSEMQNALAWITPAPDSWINSFKKGGADATEWVWEVIQGDFHEDQTTAQTITGAVVSMIPGVDQVCDVRDLVANCKKINQDSSNKWAWVALVFTLIGLFPVLGSAVKGCLKILFGYGRKGMFNMGKAAFDTDLWKVTSPYVEAGILKLNEFLKRSEVAAAMQALKWDNVYKMLAIEVRGVATKLNVGELTKVFDGALDYFKKLTEWLQRWGSAAMSSKAGQLYNIVKSVRDQANTKLGEFIAPMQKWLDKLARRLEVEADMSYRAVTNTHNPHAFKKPTLTAEIEAIKKDRPNWVDIKRSPPNKPLGASPKIPPGYPDISGSSTNRALKEKFNTFHTASPLEIAPGTTLYRVIDPGSFDNSICWMTKAEFDKLKSKDDWRRKFAVWANWNSNGEYVTYVVPPGPPLKVWEGITGSQLLTDSTGKAVDAGKGKGVYLEGGARQIVLDPGQLDKSFLGKRQATGWGYSGMGEHVDMIGVPDLKNNWYESKK